MAGVSTLISAESCSASFVTNAFELDDCEHYFVAISVSGGTTPTGSFTIEHSIDNSTWTTLSDSQGTAWSIAITDNGDHSFNVVDASYDQIRVRYTRTSGSGSCTIKVFTKRDI